MKVYKSTNAIPLPAASWPSFVSPYGTLISQTRKKRDETNGLLCSKLQILILEFEFTSDKLNRHFCCSAVVAKLAKEKPNSKNSSVPESKGIEKNGQNPKQEPEVEDVSEIGKYMNTVDRTGINPEECDQAVLPLSQFVMSDGAISYSTNVRDL